MYRHVQCSARGYRNPTTYENEGRVQVLIVVVRIISVKFCGLSSVDGEKVGAGIVGPQWFKKLFERRVEAGSQVSNNLRLAVTALKLAHYFGSS